MSIKLAVALEDNKYVRHIKDRLSKSSIYTCPFCREEVIARKGSERQHHFSHAPGTNCTASEETILHYNAKHYLLYCIKNAIDITFNVPTEMIKDSRITPIFDSLGLRKYPLSLAALIDFYGKSNGSCVEKAIGPYIVDVHMPVKMHSSFGVIFEIVVTHEMEQEKLNWLHQYGVPYLELSPVERSDNSFDFDMLRINIPHYFNRMENNFVTNSIVNFYDEIYSQLKDYIEVDHKKKQEKDLKIKAWDWVTEKILYGNLRYWVPEEAQKQMKSLTIRPFKDLAITNTKTMHGAAYKRVKEHRMVFAVDDSDHENLVLNDKNVLEELLHKLAVAYPTEMLMGKGINGREGVVGFKFLNLIDPITYEKEWQDHMKEFFLTVRNRLEKQENNEDDE
ncbi:competence protein CoiA family protein [Cohnella yongneupensis]|uniref:Competence protein CoiA family protein n=1 Tax=Cohnella yongneupensis TaxID=425006 RepID=A0ABW0R5S8_9BACL